MFFSTVFKTHWSGLCFCQSAPVSPTLPQSSWFSSPVGFLSAPELANTSVSGIVRLLFPLPGQQDPGRPGLQTPTHISSPQRNLPCTLHPKHPCPVTLYESLLFLPPLRTCQPCSFVSLPVYFLTPPNRRPFWSCSLGYLQHSID